MIPDADHIGRAPRQRDPCTDRTAAVTLQQHTGFSRHYRIRALASDGDSVTVVNRLGAIHTDRQSKPVFRQKIDSGFIQQRGIGGHGEIDLFIELAKALLSIFNNLAY